MENIELETLRIAVSVALIRLQDALDAGNRTMTDTLVADAVDMLRAAMGYDDEASA